MRHLFTALVVIMALAGSVGSPVRAQDQGPIPPAASVDPVKAALVVRYFEAIQMSKMMNGMMESMAGPIMADESVPEDKRELVRDVLLESFEVVLPEMMTAYVAIYAEAFTREELEGLVAFYESPVGRSLVSKTVILTRRSGEIYALFTPILEREMLGRLCARIGCEAPGPVPAPTVKRN